MADPLIDLIQGSGLFPEMFSPAPQAGPEQSAPALVGSLDTSGGSFLDSAEPEANPALSSLVGASPMPAPPGDVTEDFGGPPTGPSGPSSVSSSIGASASGRGFSEKKAGQLDKRDALLQRDLAQADAQANAAGQPLLNAEAAARTSQREAAVGMAKANIDKITADGHAARFFADLQDDFARTEQEADMAAKAQSTQAKMDYTAALADFRSSKVDPNQLWNNMGGANQFGTLVSVFVHDFLGVKGMHTSAMDTLNKAIDRNIDAQVQGIKVKGEVAEGFKSLWYMQRNQAASDAEARARVKGFLLESAKQNVIANMAKYQSGLATAQGQAALAAIDKEYAKNLVDIYKHIDQNAVSLRGQATQYNIAKMNAANESWANSIRAMDAKTNRMRAENEQKKQEKIAPPEPLVNPATGKVEWIFRPGNSYSDVEKKTVRETLIHTAEFNSSMEELRAMARKLPAEPDLMKGTRFSPEENRRYDALQYRLAHAAVKANNERATEQDVAQYLKSFPRETWLTRGGVETILADMHQAKIDPAFRYVQQYAVDVPDDAIPGGAQGRPFAGSYADAKAVADGTDKYKSHDTVNREDAEKLLHGPQSTKSSGDYGAYALKGHKQFVEGNPALAKKMAEETGNPFGGSLPNAEIGIANLGQLARVKENGKPTPDAIKARESLEHEASAWLQKAPGADSDWRGARAYQELQNIRNEEYDEGTPYTPPKKEADINMYGDFSK